MKRINFFYKRLRNSLLNFKSLKHVVTKLLDLQQKSIDIIFNLLDITKTSK